MGLEASSWTWMRDGIKRVVPHFALLERIENGVHIGTADVNYCIRGSEGWIEMKAVELPKREGTPVLGRKGLNKDQVNWAIERFQVRSRTWVFITAQPYRWLVSGMYAREINDWNAEMLCLHARIYTDTRWGRSEWERLVGVLSDGPTTAR